MQEIAFPSGTSSRPGNTACAAHQAAPAIPPARHIKPSRQCRPRGTHKVVPAIPPARHTLSRPGNTARAAHQPSGAPAVCCASPDLHTRRAHVFQIAPLYIRIRGRCAVRQNNRPIIKRNRIERRRAHAVRRLRTCDDNRVNMVRI